MNRNQPRIQRLQTWEYIKSDGLSEDDEYYADYDAEFGNRPVIPIRGEPVELHRDREAMRLTWKLSTATRAA